jgi:hypothetical protein
MNNSLDIPNGTNLFSDVTTIDGLMALPKDFFISKEVIIFSIVLGLVIGWIVTRD